MYRLVLSRVPAKAWVSTSIRTTMMIPNGMMRILPAPWAVSPANRLLSAVSTNHENDVDEYDDGEESNALGSREKWMDYFEGLKKHLEEVRKEKGLSEDDSVYPTTEFFKNWVNKQRYYHKIGRQLDPQGTNERCVELLESIGVPIDPYLHAWNDQYDRLKRYVEEHGEFPYDTPYHDTNGEVRLLTDWTRRQKELYKDFIQGKEKTTMTKERIEKLEKLGFEWNTNDARWNRNYEALKEFYEHHGHSLVPTDYPANPRLGKFVVRMRNEYKNRQRGADRCITPERIKLLEQVDFAFDGREANWQIKYQQLAEHVKMNGRGSIPSEKSNRLLRYWVMHQFRQYRAMMKGQKTPLEGRRKELLDKLGMPWPASS